MVIPVFVRRCAVSATATLVCLVVFSECSQKLNVVFVDPISQIRVDGHLFLFRLADGVDRCFHTTGACQVFGCFIGWGL